MLATNAVLSGMTDFEQFEQKRITIREKVENLIRKFPFLKEDYNKLVWFFWFYEDGIHKIIQPNGMIELKKFPRLTKVESITRAFREISNIKKKPFAIPVPAVQEARAIEEQHYQEYYGRKKREQEEFW
jgi:hypothetical protein